MAPELPLRNILPLHSTAEHNAFPHQRSLSYPLVDIRAAQTAYASQKLYDLPKDWPIELVRHWLQACLSHHDFCQGEGKPVTGLRLIDCNTLNIIEADVDPSYVALSYVWGKLRQHPEATVQQGVLPRPLPLLISDAIEVAKQLGFQHLWVDKYCIDQNNPQVKHDQIKQMDLVYRNAQLTIIAAAGQDETYGLPGVSTCPRRTLPSRIKRGRSISETGQTLCGIKCYYDGRLSTTSTIRDVQRAVQCSKWSTRGWTYQEGSLSRRCLAFTDEQVYFECDSGVCYCEAHDAADSSNGSEVGIFRTLVANPRTTFDRQYLALLVAIEEYSRRELTYDSDILNAFAGIMRRYQSLSPSIRQICGIPFITHQASRPARHTRPDDGGAGTDTETDGSSPPPPLHDLDWDLEQQLRDSSFVYTLGWAHKHSSWEDVRPRRRGQQPSWSCFEWAGELTCSWWGSTRLYDFQPFAEDVRVQLRDGRVVPYQDAAAAGSSSTSPAPASASASAAAALLFSSLPVPPQLVEVKWNRHNRVEWSVCGFRASVSLSAGADSPFRFRRELVKRAAAAGHSSSRRRRRSFEVVVLGGDGDWKPPSRERCLLLVLRRCRGRRGSRRGEAWERCGVVRVDCSLSGLLEELGRNGVFATFERRRVYRVE